MQLSKKTIMARSFSLSLAVFLLAFISSNASGEAPHRFRAGDIISADMINESFNRFSLDLSKTLIGTWSTQCVDATTSDPDNPAVGVLTINSLTDISYTGTSCLGRMNANNDGQGMFSLDKVIKN